MRQRSKPAIAHIRQMVDAALHSLAVKRLVETHLADWRVAYDEFRGAGSTRRRATAIHGIYDAAAPLPDAVMTLARGDVPRGDSADCHVGNRGQRRCGAIDLACTSLRQPWDMGSGARRYDTHPDWRTGPPLVTCVIGRALSGSYNEPESCTGRQSTLQEAHMKMATLRSQGTPVHRQDATTPLGPEGARP